MNNTGVVLALSVVIFILALIGRRMIRAFLKAKRVGLRWSHVSKADVTGENIIIYEPLAGDPLPYDPFYFVDQMETTELKDEALINIAFSLIPDTATNEVERWFNDGGRDILKAALISHYHKGVGFRDICSIVINSTYPDLFQAS